MRKIIQYASLCLVASIPATNGEIGGAQGGIGSIHQILGGIMLLLWLTHTIVTGKVRQPNGFHLFALAFIVWNVISLIWTLDQTLTVTRLLRLVQSAGISLILWDIFRTLGESEQVFQAYVVGAYISIFRTAWQVHSGVQTNHWDSRFAAGGFDPNDLGLSLILGVPMAWHLAIVKKGGNGAVELINFFYPMAAVSALVMTGSRGALVSFGPALVLLALTWRQIPTIRVATVVAILVFAIVLAGHFHMMSHSQVLTDSLHRLGTTSSSASGDGFSGRFDIWRAAASIFSQHPILGVGSGAFPAAAAHYSIHASVSGGLVAHNTYISVATELGVCGFALFAALLASVVRAIRQQTGSMRMILLTIFAVWVVGVFGMTWEYRAQTWLALTMIVTCANSVASIPETEADTSLTSKWTPRVLGLSS